MEKINKLGEQPLFSPLMMLALGDLIITDKRTLVLLPVAV
jgi:hypothetical protein